MTFLRTFTLTIIVFLLLIAGFILGNLSGFEIGYGVGNKAGFENGSSSGYVTGFKDGYAQGEQLSIFVVCFQNCQGETTSEDFLECLNERCWRK